MAYEYTNAKGQKYYLNNREVTLKGSGKQQTIYFFSKNPTDTSIEEVPTDYEVIENPRTGLPVLRKG